MNFGMMWLPSATTVWKLCASPNRSTKCNRLCDSTIKQFIVYPNDQHCLCLCLSEKNLNNKWSYAYVYIKCQWMLLMVLSARRLCDITSGWKTIERFSALPYSNALHFWLRFRRLSTVWTDPFWMFDASFVIHLCGSLCIGF